MELKESAFLVFVGTLPAATKVKLTFVSSNPSLRVTAARVEKGVRG